MKKNYLILGFVLSTLAWFSCQTKTNENIETTESKAIDTTELNTTISTEEIDKMRANIEALTIPPQEISTANLREKTKQKWEKIHFYVENDVVVKVKTYAYSKVSRRTEEFYANKEGLVLVVIEDNGEGKRGKEKAAIDKMYYFNNGKLIEEMNKEKSEYTVKESDAEELLSEFKEYLEIYQQNKK